MHPAHEPPAPGIAATARLSGRARAEEENEVQHVGPQPHPAETDEGRSAYVLNDLLASIWRNKVLIVLMTVLGGAAAYPVARDLPDIYVGEAMLISEAGLSGIVALGTGDASPIIDPSATSTIVDTISAPVVMERALALLPPDLLAGLTDEAEIDETLAAMVAEGRTVDDALRQSLLRKHLRENLEVGNSGRSYVISVRFRSESPEIAKSVANAVADGYLSYRSELKRGAQTQMLGSLGSEIDALKQELRTADRTAETIRKEVSLLATRFEALTGRQQTEAITENAELFAQQQEAEREAEAMAAVYEQLLFTQREIQSQIGVPELDVQLFAPAVVPLQPSGFNAKPVLMALGLLGGFLVGTSLGLLRAPWRRRALSRDP